MSQDRALKILIILAASSLSLTACSDRPERLILQHPPAEDLTCPAEPEVPGEGAAAAAYLDFDRDVLLAGRGCRDALARVCRWHVERGLELPAGLRCG